MNIVLPKPLLERKDTVVLDRKDWDKLAKQLDQQQKPSYPEKGYTADETEDMVFNDAHPLTIWRKRKQLTQHDLAEKTGISQSYINAIENRKKTGSTRVLAKIAKYIGAPLEDLVDL